jgi:predicted DNA-binding protein with PD1-like motif
MGNYRVKRTVIGQLERGTDLYAGVTRVVQEHRIAVGRVTGMGAVQRATLAYYNQKTMTYQTIELNEPLEIVSLYGNISLKDGEPFAHVHVVLSDEKGNGKGGHLLPGGTPVFACELTIEEFEGPPLARGTDAATGRSLWSKDAAI